MAWRKDLNLKHGGTVGYCHSRTYSIWHQMVRRCTYPKNPGYANYGGRGITVCEEWLDFAVFLRDMGSAPAGLTIERIDNDAGYSPSNCKWATRKEQANNRRSSHLVTHAGKTMTIEQWGRESGLKSSTFRQRFYGYQWPMERCLQPLMREKKIG